MRLFDQPDWIIPKRLRPKCGAKTRTGRPCIALAVWDKENDCPVNGRCRFHGGLSTGPKTVEGLRRVTANLPQYQGKAFIGDCIQVDDSKAQLEGNNQ